MHVHMIRKLRSLQHPWYQALNTPLSYSFRRSVARFRTVMSSCSPAATHQLQSSSGGAKRPAAASFPPMKKHMRVVETVTAPDDFETRRLPAALLLLLPHRYATETAAKKACRRGEVLVDGENGGTVAEVTGNTVIEVITAVWHELEQKVSFKHDPCHHMAESSE